MNILKTCVLTMVDYGNRVFHTWTFDNEKQARKFMSEVVNEIVVSNGINVKKYKSSKYEHQISIQENNVDVEVKIEVFAKILA